MLRTIANFSKSFMVFVAASTLGRSHLVFSDPYFIPTHVAWDNRQKMLCQQNIAIIGADDFYFRINEDQMWTTKRQNRAMEQRIMPVPQSLRASRKKTFRTSSLIKKAIKNFLQKIIKDNFMQK